MECVGWCVFNECNNLKTAKIKSKCEIPANTFIYCENLEKIYIEKDFPDFSPDFMNEYKNKIEIIKIKTLDDLLAEGKSLREISNIYKNEER